MEYTVKKLAKLSGVTARTLRYYDEIGILKPARINSSGYRIYGSREVDRLQQILFYRELGLGLDDIKKIILSPCFDEVQALKYHHEKLLDEKARLERLISNVEKTIAQKEGRVDMSDREKFEGFKKNLVNENESKYGAEIRSKYGDKTVDESNRKMMNMTKEQYDEFTKLGEKINELLKKACESGDPAGELAQEVADLHRQWLCFTWPEYTREAHAGLAKMYVHDERFKKYYDEICPGAAEFLKEAILIYTGKK